jgi:hypothetical protein
VSQLPTEELIKRNDKTGNSSIGMHIRHILEFYIGILDDDQVTIINYDLRKRDLVLEYDVSAILETISRLKTQLNSLSTEQLDRPIDFQASYSAISDQKESHPSSLSRELAYGLEHAIHHLAIIKLCCHVLEIPIAVDGNFGVAYSTQRNATVCAQ